MPKLSICIPTYNRRDMLKHALDSILPQVVDGVEIVVSDNASTDGTDALLQEYSRKYAFLRYFRQSSNIGADRNFLSVVEYASGDYCWLLGSDDAIAENSISVVLKEIGGGHSILNCNRTWCDYNLNPIVQESWLHPIVPTHTFHASSPWEMLDYYSQVQSLGGLFSCMSTLVFRRDQWMAIDRAQTLKFITYPHVFNMLTILSTGGTLRYLTPQLVLCRGNNDSFLQEHGIARRLLVDIERYTDFADHFYGHQPAIHRAFLRVLRLQDPSSCVAMIKSTADDADWHDAQKYLRRAGYVPFYLDMIQNVWI